MLILAVEVVQVSHTLMPGRARSGPWRARKAEFIVADSLSVVVEAKRSPVGKESVIWDMLIRETGGEAHPTLPINSKGNGRAQGLDENCVKKPV